MENLNYIITAKHYGNGSARGYIRKIQSEMYKRGIQVQIIGLDDAPVGTAVRARIWQGQWISDCECGGASFVDPDEPVFFCFGCGNRAHGKRVRPVEFPTGREEIERVVLARPVNDLAGLTDLERAGMSKPVLFVSGQPLLRSWRPGESVEDLHAQQDAVIRDYEVRNVVR